MDGEGGVFDNLFVERLWQNVKPEDVYLKGYATMGERMLGLTEYFAVHNGERAQPSQNDQAPGVSNRYRWRADDRG